MNNNDQIIVLESKIAYLENDIDELNLVLISQGKQIDKLMNLLEDLQSKLDQKKDMDDIKDEKPPHY